MAPPAGRDRAGVAGVRRARPRPRPGHRPAPRGLRHRPRARARARRYGRARRHAPTRPAHRCRWQTTSSTRRARDARASRRRAGLGDRGLAPQLRRLGTHSAIYGIGGLVSRVIAVLLLPLYTRYLTPADYGEIETLLALIDRDGDRPPPRDHERVLPLLLRRRRTTSIGCASSARRSGSRWRCATLGLVVGVALAGPISELLFGDRRREPRRARRRRALGADELRAADLALPGRGALGRVRRREPRERPHHDRRDARSSSSCSTRARSGSSSATSAAR